MCCSDSWKGSQKILLVAAGLGALAKGRFVSDGKEKTPKLSLLPCLGYSSPLLLFITLQNDKTIQNRVIAQAFSNWQESDLQNDPKHD